ncbi:MAG: hypothetical protein BGO69_15375 [Bacteroidetes bacterium 46-16]|nr:MAG: hypothetical protein BGO69_15375 [Bacteroidetes bacterium 46-16]
MKKLFITLVCLSIGTLGAQAQGVSQASSQSQPQTTAKENPNAAKFKFKDEVHDFGELQEGPEAKYSFEFTNVGKEPLIIQNATGSCGCTVPDWPKQPILPGKKGQINVTYHTQGRVGPFMKDVYIQYNGSSERYTLHIKGTVKANPNPTTPSVNNNGTTNH